MFTARGILRIGLDGFLNKRTNFQRAGQVRIPADASLHGCQSLFSKWCVPVPPFASDGFILLLWELIFLCRLYIHNFDIYGHTHNGSGWAGRRTGEKCGYRLLAVGRDSPGLL